MGGIDGLGEAVTGTALAAAVEPTAGGDSDRHDTACLNCSTPLTGAFCSACGQKARVHRSLASFLGDMVKGLFNFEGKIWRTMPMLVLWPGEMTRRYVAGERARFVSPVALYLFSVFAMFAVLNFTGTLGPDIGQFSSSLKKAEVELRKELSQLEAERRSKGADKSQIASIDLKIAAKKDDISRIEKAKAGQIIQYDGAKDSDAPAWLRVAAAKIAANPQAFILKVQDAASKFSWLLIPLSIPFVWLLFPFNRRYHLYDHTVFVTYSLSFMMILVIVGGLLIAMGATSLASMLFFLPPIHMYRQLRGAYELGRISALLRTVLLTIFAFIASGFFLVAMLAAGIF